MRPIVSLSFPPALLLSVALAGLPAQSAPGITAEHVKDVVSFLASDEMAGRDTPSPGLEKAAEYLAERFAAAGLEPVSRGDWFHRYTLPGIELDSTVMEVTLHSEGKPDLVLAPDIDVRLLRAGEQTEEEMATATIVRVSDEGLDRMLMMRGSRQPLFIEVGKDNAYWALAGGKREILPGRRNSSHPVFLIRRGILPMAKDAGEYTVTYEMPAPATMDVPLKNVVGVLRGSELPDEYVVVSAHYDHIGVGMPVEGDAIYNGADDDATGTTAVVLLAEKLAAGERPKRSLLFVCFSGEEKGLRGSRAFAEEPPVPLDKVVANVNIEMIGRPDPGKERMAWITGASLSDFAEIAGAALERAGIRVTDYEHAERLFTGSDNLSLARKGVVAHSISAGALHSDYHRPTDEVGKLDLEHMAAVIKGLQEVVLEMANRAERPEYNEAGREMLERLTRRR